MENTTDGNDLVNMKLKMDVSEKTLDVNFNVKFEVESGSDDEDDWCIGNSDVADQTKEEIFDDLSFQQYLRTLGRVKIECSVYECHYCSACYGSKHLLEQHIYKNHIPKKTKSDQECIEDNLLRDHRLNVKTEQLYKCEICSAEISSNNYRKHVKQVHCRKKDEKYKCIECNKTFKQESYLKNHLLYNSKHSNFRPAWRSHKIINADIECQKCPLKFQNTNAFKKHMNNVHCEGQFECDICQSKLKSKTYLQAHFRRVHFDDGRVHKCNVCLKVFKSPRYVKIHKKNNKKCNEVLRLKKC